MTLIFKLVNRVAPAYTARVAFTPRRELHLMCADIAHQTEWERRNAVRSMFIADECGAELAERWFLDAVMGECTGDFTF